MYNKHVLIADSYEPTQSAESVAHLQARCLLYELTLFPDLPTFHSNPSPAHSVEPPSVSVPLRSILVFLAICIYIENKIPCSQDVNVSWIADLDCAAAFQIGCSGMILQQLTRRHTMGWQDTIRLNTNAFDMISTPSTSHKTRNGQFECNKRWWGFRWWDSIRTVGLELPSLNSIMVLLQAEYVGGMLGRLRMLFCLHCANTTFRTIWACMIYFAVQTTSR